MFATPGQPLNTSLTICWQHISINLLVFLRCRRHSKHQPLTTIKTSVCDESSDVPAVLAEQYLMKTPFEINLAEHGTPVQVV